MSVGIEKRKPVLRRQPSPDRIPVNLELSGALWREFKSECALNGTTMSFELEEELPKIIRRLFLQREVI